MIVTRPPGLADKWKTLCFNGQPGCSQVGSLLSLLEEQGLISFAKINKEDKETIYVVLKLLTVP